MPTVSRSTIWTLYFIVFVDIFQITFVFPILPKIVEGYGKGATEIGLLGSIAAAAEALASPFLGGLSDRHGRRPVLMAAMLGSAIDSFILGLSGSYLVVVAARLVGGICGGTGGVVMAYIAEVTSEEERPGYVTKFMASIFAGAAVGPAIAGGINSVAGWRASCFAAGAICILNFLCTAAFLPPNPGAAQPSEAAAEQGESSAAPAEPADAAADMAPEASRSSLLGGCCKYCTLPLGAWLIGASNFFASIGFTAFEAIGVLYVQDTFFDGDADPATFFYSNVISAVGVTGLVTNLVLYSPIQKVTGLKGSIALGGVLKAVGFGGIALSSLSAVPGNAGKWWFFTAVQVLAFGDQIQCTSIQTIITTVVDPCEFGKAMGIMNSCSNAARALGPFTFGPIYEHVGHALPWYANIGTALLAALVPMFVPRRQPDADAEAREVAPAEPDALVRQLSLSHQPTRAMCTNLPTLYRAYSQEDLKAPALRRRLTWGGGARDAPLMTSIQRSSTTG